MITILTPTYNRASNLIKLYNSLIVQTCQEFEWIVVDDGSSDNTKEVIEGFINSSDRNFELEYVFQDNGGKHTALNNGIKFAKGELLFIVDSDDWLSEDAVETILNYHEKYKLKKENDKLCGYCFLRAYSNGSVNTGEFPVDEAIDTYRQQRINNNLLGDKAEVYYTAILKKYPFEEFEGERFMPEDAVWLKMSGPYNMVHINRVIYYSDYLEGGLTKTGRKMKIHSPYGMMYRSAIYLNDPLVFLKPKLKMAVLYDIYSSFAKKEDSKKSYGFEKINEKKRKCIVENVMGKTLIILAYIPSVFIYMLWSRKYS